MNLETCLRAVRRVLDDPLVTDVTIKRWNDFSDDGEDMVFYFVEVRSGISEEFESDS